VATNPLIAPTPWLGEGGDLGVRPGSEMELNVQAGALLARLAETIDLNALLAEITAENQHGECDWGEASGVEAW